MKKLLLLFILGITYAVDCPICSENLIEISANSNNQSKNKYACSNTHSFQLTPDEYTQFDKANSTEKSKINYYTPKSLEESRYNKVDQSRETKHPALLLSLGLVIGAITAVSFLI
jgi:hypothetical protein